MFRENHKSVHRTPKFRYFTKVITYSKSLDHLLQSYRVLQKKVPLFDQA